MYYLLPTPSFSPGYLYFSSNCTPGPLYMMSRSSLSPLICEPLPEQSAYTMVYLGRRWSRDRVGSSITSRGSQLCAKRQAQLPSWYTPLVWVLEQVLISHCQAPQPALPVILHFLDQGVPLRIPEAKVKVDSVSTSRVHWSISRQRGQ